MMMLSCIVVHKPRRLNRRMSLRSSLRTCCSSFGCMHRHMIMLPMQQHRVVSTVMSRASTPSCPNERVRISLPPTSMPMKNNIIQIESVSMCPTQRCGH